MLVLVLFESVAADRAGCVNPVSFASVISPVNASARAESRAVEPVVVLFSALIAVALFGFSVFPRFFANTLVELNTSF